MRSSPVAPVATSSPLRIFGPGAWRLLPGYALVLAGALMSDPRLDRPAFVQLQALSAHVPAAFWSAWSVLGLGLSCVLVAGLASDERMGPVTTMLWSLVIGGLALQLFKRAWVVPRPAAVLPPELLHVIGLRLHAGSMPSGHAAMLTALACALLGRWPRPPPTLVATAFACAAIGSFARVAVGAHWPSDVLAGAGIGLLSVAAARATETRMFSLRRRLATPAGRRFFALVELVSGIALLLMDTGYPLALPVQWLLGIAAIVSALHRWHTAAQRLRTDAVS